MSSAFEQQLGAAGDVRELEYISALHQTTTEEVRRDASIKAEDIQRFLMSRYGIKVTEEEVKQTILQGLGGGIEEDDVLDLMEVVAMLLIPIFLKAARKEYLVDDGTAHDNEAEQMSALEESAVATNSRSVKSSKLEAKEDGLIPTPPGLLDFVLKMILHDVTGSKVPKRLTTDLIRRILISHGEIALANNDELVEEMLEAATTFDVAVKGGADTENQNPMLDVETFATALTHDIHLYDIKNECRLTTNFNDVYVTDEDLAAREEQMFATVTTSEELIRRHRENQTIRAKVQISEKLERIQTVPFIDTTAGTYRSKGLLVLLWATVLLTYFAYLWDFRRDLDENCGEELAYIYNSPWSQNAEAIVCESFVSIFLWLFFFFSMSVFGLVSVYLGSFGNGVDCQNYLRPLLSSAFVLLLVVVPFAAFRPEDDRRENGVLYVASVVFGMLTVGFCLSRAAELYFSDAQMEEFKSYLPKFEHPIFKSTVSEERTVKQATARKLSQMTRNALKINKLKSPDSILNTHYGQALKSYETESRNPNNIAIAGGFFWTWRRLLGRGDHFAKAGIWVPARMISSNLAQYVVAFYVIFAGINLARYFEQNYDIEWAKRNFDRYIDRAIGVAENDELVVDTVANVTSVFGQYLNEAQSNGTVDLGCGDYDTTPEEFFAKHCSNIDGNPVCERSPGLNYLCPLADPTARESLNATSRLALMDASGFGSSFLKGTVADAAQEAASASVDTLYPAEKYMITVPMYIGTVIAFLVAMSLAIQYIPSVTTTILKLRSGNIATLRNKDFNRYRCAPDQVALLTGSLFWGSLASSVVVGGFIGLIIFFFLWQASVYYAQRAVAFLAGVISVTLVRLAIVCTCRCLLWTSFYRVRPGAANISICALEWGSFALSAGYVIARSLKLLLAAMMFIGRIDTPFLAHNVGRIGPLELDNYPIVHMKDVLTHEAHRHPYIEQLGVIYLMKLRYKKHFGKRAGTCWRMIFVYALMPWLSRYRIMARQDEVTNKPNDDPDKEEPSSLQFMSVRNVNPSFAGEEDADHAQAEAMWRMKANVFRGLENFHRRRNQELEEEVEQLRVSLAEARSITNQDLVDEVQRLKEALAAATTKHNRTDKSSKEQPASRKPETSPARRDGADNGTASGEFDTPSLFDLQPMAPPQPANDLPEVSTNPSLASEGSMDV